MHSVPSELIRKKRDIPTPTIRLEDLFENNNRYTEFINQLRDLFSRDTNGNINYVGPSDNIPVIRGDGGGTVVELVGSDQVGSVRLVFRNSDLYVIGFIRDGVFYRMREIENGRNINEGINVGISNITDMPAVTAYGGNFERIDIDPDNLIRPLIRYAERRNLNSSDPQRLDENSTLPPETRISIFRFALIISEAIRFLPIQYEVQRTFMEISTTFQPQDVNLNLPISEAIRRQLSPNSAPISTDSPIDLNWMLRQWRSFTEFMNPLRGAPNVLVSHLREWFSLDYSRLFAILGLAHPCANPYLPGPSGRFPRDTESHSPDKCYLGDIGREGIITGNSYWDSDSASILISEILDTHKKV
ncbi:hypothetical protein TNCT_386721 [Trichonephila clavata]|uniref:Uncharacterized protein n=1 Tax=Trichonephila clavata TaxID=2740835 RepID=A0A8X6HJE0_TRICU|nr:hypothetical protein TNCT_412361 [Trichonephila clavata]GFR27330.1 hypothetical protein TNCT_386721 [Trichonephila clavata]